MYNGVFIILENKGWYQLFETKYFMCLSAGSWEQVTNTLRGYVMKFDEDEFYGKVNELRQVNKISPATYEQVARENRINGDLFDYDINRIINEAYHDRRYF